MNIRKIIKEEMDDFDWVRDVSGDRTFGGVNIPFNELRVGDEFYCEPKNSTRVEKKLFADHTFTMVSKVYKGFIIGKINGDSKLGWPCYPHVKNYPNRTDKCWGVGINDVSEVNLINRQK